MTIAQPDGDEVLTSKFRLQVLIRQELKLRFDFVFSLDLVLATR
jgi:hypothetical protein